MNLTAIIEVAIGVMFVWILLAVITSAMQEWISQLFKWKANMLEEAIVNILADKNLASEFYQHPLIKSLHSSGGNRKPSKIPNKQFTSVVFDLLIKADAPQKTAQAIINAGTENSEATRAGSFIDQVRGSIDRLSLKENSSFATLAGALDTLLIDISTDVKEADTAVADARKRVESWYDDAMDRLGGSYKRQIQKWGLVIGIVLALAINADSLSIANHLWRDPLVREALVMQADQFQLPQDNQGQETAIQYYEELNSLALPIGWTSENIPSDFQGWIFKLGGILFSGVAAAQGAPYWFDIMRKLLNMRSGGGGGESSKKEEK